MWLQVSLIIELQKLETELMEMLSFPHLENRGNNVTPYPVVMNKKYDCQANCNINSCKLNTK